MKKLGLLQLLLPTVGWQSVWGRCPGSCQFGGLSTLLMASGARSEEVGVGRGGYDVLGCDLTEARGSSPSGHHPLPHRTSRALQPCDGSRLASWKERVLPTHQMPAMRLVSTTAFC